MGMKQFHIAGTTRAKSTATGPADPATAALTMSAAHGQSTRATGLRCAAAPWSVDTGTYVDMASRVQKAADTAPKPGADAKPVPLDSYTMQYQGVLQGSTKMIHILGACKVEDAMMRKLAAQWNVVSNGGACYFEADYNPTSKTYTKFSFNS